MPGGIRPSLSAAANSASLAQDQLGTERDQVPSPYETGGL